MSLLLCCVCLSSVSVGYGSVHTSFVAFDSPGHESRLVLCLALACPIDGVEQLPDPTRVAEANHQGPQPQHVDEPELPGGVASEVRADGLAVPSIAIRVASVCVLAASSVDRALLLSDRLDRSLVVCDLLRPPRT